MIKLFDKNMNEIVFDITNYQLSLLPLDNFSAFGLKMDGEYFQTSEHAFQFLKFVNTNYNLAKEIQNTYSPNEARRIAHENKKDKLSNWNNVKYTNMEKNIKIKSTTKSSCVKKIIRN